MFKTAIFDMDGVIIDSEPIYRMVEYNIMKKIGIDTSDEDHSYFVGSPSKNMWAYYKKKYNLNYSVEELNKREKEEYLKRIEKQTDIKPIQGVIKLIQDLKENNIKLAVASSSLIKIIDFVLELFDIKNLFMTSVSSEDIENGKPEPDIFLKAATMTDSRPNECIVVEDSRNGILAAKAAGMKCIGYYNPNSGHQDISEADLVVNSFKELNYNRLKKMF